MARRDTHRRDEPIIRVQGLRNSFGDAVIHDNLDLEVRRGEILGVVGGSGTARAAFFASSSHTPVGSAWLSRSQARQAASSGTTSSGWTAISSGTPGATAPRRRGRARA